MLPLGAAPRTRSEARLTRETLMRWARSQLGSVAGQAQWTGADEVSISSAARELHGDRGFGADREALPAVARGEWVTLLARTAASNWKAGPRHCRTPKRAAGAGTCPRALPVPWSRESWPAAAWRWSHEALAPASRRPPCLPCGTSQALTESLYREGSFRPLTADNKAFRVGDVLTVQVFENSSASSSAETGTRRKNNLNAELTHGGARAWSAGLTVDGDFDGGGRTQRSNRVLITLSVSVKEVLPNGDLRSAANSC